MAWYPPSDGPLKTPFPEPPPNTTDHTFKCTVGSKAPTGTHPPLLVLHYDHPCALTYLTLDEAADFIALLLDSFHDVAEMTRLWQPLTGEVQ